MENIHIYCISNAQTNIYENSLSKFTNLLPNDIARTDSNWYMSLESIAFNTSFDQIESAPSKNHFHFYCIPEIKKGLKQVTYEDIPKKYGLNFSTTTCTGKTLQRDFYRLVAKNDVFSDNYIAINTYIGDPNTILITKRREVSVPKYTLLIYKNLLNVFNINPKIKNLRNVVNIDNFEYVRFPTTTKTFTLTIKEDIKYQPDLILIKSINIEANTNDAIDNHILGTVVFSNNKNSNNVERDSYFSHEFESKLYYPLNTSSINNLNFELLNKSGLPLQLQVGTSTVIKVNIKNMNQNYESFHKFLSSNQSSKLYPKNTNSDFKISLNNPVNFSTKWEVAISQISIPNNYTTIPSNYIMTIEQYEVSHNWEKKYNWLTPAESYTYFKQSEIRAFLLYMESKNMDNVDPLDESVKYYNPFDVEPFKIAIKGQTPTQSELNQSIRIISKQINQINLPQGNITSISELISLLQNNIPDAIICTLTDNNYVKIEYKKYCTISLNIEYARLLGFAPISDEQIVTLSGYPTDTIVAPFPVNLDSMKPKLIYIFSDFIKESVVGGTLKHILKAIPIVKSSSLYYTHNFEHLEYYEVNTNELSTLNFQIRNHFFKKISYISKIHPIYITLTFRKH